jgi:DNA-directed RNA polymerase specialized sigma24 family protein
MSPRTVRRYRAELLLRKEFEGLRGRVTASARARLRGYGVSLDPSDLDACYSAAWQGLYMAMLEGQEIENPAGWLTVATFRRAIEEHRADGRARRLSERMQDGAGGAWCVGQGSMRDAASRHDLAGELDDRVRLRQLFEGLRGRLSAREREAAVLCYLQGFSRAQAAERMGVSEKRMRKLMEGAGAGRPGVAGKVGALVEAIRDGEWCEEQGSLMRALAYGVLDPAGERYQLALLHRSQCPACRSYVLSLRGLAATLPPVFLPWGLGAAALAGGGARVGAEATRTGAGAGALSASGAAGAGAGAGGAAGGGWLLAGGAKLAAGCVLALSLGAGCVALESEAHRHHSPAHAHAAVRVASARPIATPGQAQAGTGSLSTPAPGAGAGASSLTPAAHASREFGPERALAGAPGQAASSAAPRSPIARSASSSRSAGTAPAEAPSSVRAGQPTAAGASAAHPSAAEHEFSPG